MSQFEPAVIVSNKNENVSIFETIDAIKDAGFKNVFLEWYNKDLEVSQEEQLQYVKDKGLNVIFVHLGYESIDNLWIEEETNIVQRYKNDIRSCYENNIPMVIMHLTNKKNNPTISEIGLKRVKEICDYAKSLNIKIAFENTKIKEYLYYVIDNIKNDNVGICFDTGHYHTHFKDKIDFNRLKNRIFAVHLHDNDQSYDQHLLPYDGTLNWDKTIKKIKDCNYTGPVTLEIHYRNIYTNITINKYYKKGYEIALKIKKIFEEYEKC